MEPAVHRPAAGEAGEGAAEAAEEEEEGCSSKAPMSRRAIPSLSPSMSSCSAVQVEPLRRRPVARVDQGGVGAQVEVTGRDIDEAGVTDVRDVVWVMLAPAPTMALPVGS